MRRLFFFLLILLAGYVGYMYYFGKGEDKANAETVILETKDLGKAIGDFLKKQKIRYDEGEFDQLIDKIGRNLEKLKSTKSENEEQVKDNLRNLEKELKNIDAQKLNEENRKALEKILDDVKTELEE